VTGVLRHGSIAILARCRVTEREVEALQAATIPIDTRRLTLQLPNQATTHVYARRALLGVALRDFDCGIATCEAGQSRIAWLLKQRHMHDMRSRYRLLLESAATWRAMEAPPGHVDIECEDTYCVGVGGTALHFPSAPVLPTSDYSRVIAEVFTLHEHVSSVFTQPALQREARKLLDSTFLLGLPACATSIEVKRATTFALETAAHACGYRQAEGAERADGHTWVAWHETRDT